MDVFLLLLIDRFLLFCFKRNTAHKAAQAKYLPLEFVSAISTFLYYATQSYYAKHP